MQKSKSEAEFARIYEVQEMMWRVNEGEADGTEVKRIIEVLKNNPSAIVRHEAASSLGEIASVEAVQALAEAILKDPSSLVRHESAEALGWIPTPESRKALEAVLMDKGKEVVETARISFGMHRNPRRANVSRY